MNKILIPTNFSDTSHRVIRGALSFFEGIREKLTCILLNTYMVPPSSLDRIVGINDGLKKRSLGGLKQELEIVRSWPTQSHVVFETMSQIGVPSHVIPRIVEEQGVDCVAIGKSSQSRQEEIAALANRLSCPLLVIP